ncbi:hypothetical protein FNV43_RR26590 [Rhamnella rubrinervis]|uniref:Uncharacterized protein n=1 Tax=Rhamnella rubrinervis TaxID=2594499 RepID=A0A8K0DPL4_9ROSA|nr:hypothetical protein FNV43_RR26590 [Rhamnella rubrinervis]
MAERKRMEADKRKQTDVDGVSGRRRKKARDDDGEVTAATEEEVEEFYAILRRINDAVSYFKKGDGNVKWLRAMLDGGRFEEDDGVKGEARREEEGVEENVGFDLNADPGP